MKNKLIAHNGSVQNIDEIPADLKDLYKTVWEIKIRTQVDMAADRYVCLLLGFGCVCSGVGFVVRDFDC